jgi:hypothetical protein
MPAGQSGVALVSRRPSGYGRTSASLPAALPKPEVQHATCNAQLPAGRCGVPPGGFGCGRDARAPLYEHSSILVGLAYHGTLPPVVVFNRGGAMECPQGGNWEGW